MRVYYFTTAQFALANIRNRRLKISDILQLNDPFEFAALRCQEKSLRRALRQMKSQIAQRSGVICFSRRWSHPLMWSHYADRHRGICLGFDLADQWARAVTYLTERPLIGSEALLTNREAQEAFKDLLCAKAHFWSYEKEVRIFCSSVARDASGLAFMDFSEDLKLREVIVGPECGASRAEVDLCLGLLRSEIEPIKARIAFRTFNVVRNKNDRLWS